MNNKPAKTFFLLVIVIITAIALINLLTGPSSILSPAEREITAGQLMSQLHAGEISSLSWQEETLTGETRAGERFTTTYVKPSDPAATTVTELVRELNTNKDPRDDVNLRMLEKPMSATMISVLSIIAFPLVLIALIYFLVLRPAQMRGP